MLSMITCLCLLGNPAFADSHDEDTGTPAIEDTGAIDDEDTGTDETNDTGTPDPEDSGLNDTSDTGTTVDTGDTATTDTGTTLLDTASDVISASGLAKETGGTGCATVGMGGMVAFWAATFFVGIRRED